MRTMLAFVTAALLLITSGVSYADNILINPGFETGDIEPWEHYEFVVSPGGPIPEQLWITTTENPHSGQYCARGWGDFLIFQQEIEPIQVSSITEFSCWLRQADAGPNTGLCIGMQFDDPDDGMPGVGMLFDRNLTSTDWCFYDGLAELQSAAQMAEQTLGDGCRLVGVGVNGTFGTITYVDDWVLVPEPASLTLWALAGLIVLRSRRA